MRNVRIRTILRLFCANLGSQLCTANPRIVLAHVYVPRFLHACSVFASQGTSERGQQRRLCVVPGLFSHKEYCMLRSLATWNQGATPFRFTQNEHTQYFEKGAICSCLKQSASLRKPNECAEIAYVSIQGFCKERSWRTRHSTFAQSLDCCAE